MVFDIITQIRACSILAKVDMIFKRENNINIIFFKIFYNSFFYRQTTYLFCNYNILHTTVLIIDRCFVSYEIKWNLIFQGLLYRSHNKKKKIVVISPGPWPWILLLKVNSQETLLHWFRSLSTVATLLHLFIQTVLR